MTDLISRADAIEAVQKEYEDAINIGDNGDAIAYDVGRILSALPSAKYVTEKPNDAVKASNDVINRADAIEAVAIAICKDYDEIEALKALPSAEAVHKPDYSYEAGMARRFKEALPAETVQEWIPCSERLPDVDVEVLATVDWSDVRIAWLIKGGAWETDVYILDHDEIIAWMPLPKPYREDGEA